MTRRYLIPLAVALASLLSHPVSAQQAAKPSAQQMREGIQAQLPAAPAGYSWQIYRNALFPKPAGWKEAEKTGSTSGIPMGLYGMSPQEFGNGKKMELGLTVQIIAGPRKAGGVDAKKMALAYIQPFLDSHKQEDVLALQQGTQGDFEVFLFRYRDFPQGGQPLVVHKFILANDLTDSVHIFSFQSPAATWDDNWARFGTPILSKVSVIPGLTADQ